MYKCYTIYNSDSHVKILFILLLTTLNIRAYVTVDSKLRFNEHIDRKIPKATKFHGYLHPIIDWYSKLPIAVKTLIYLDVFRLVAMYVCESSVWSAFCNMTRRKKRQKWKNVEGGLGFRIVTIHDTLRIPTLHFAKETDAKFFRLSGSPRNPTLQSYAGKTDRLKHETEFYSRGL